MKIVSVRRQEAIPMKKFHHQRMKVDYSQFPIPNSQFLLSSQEGIKF